MTTSRRRQREREILFGHELKEFGECSENERWDTRSSTAWRMGSSSSKIRGSAGEVGLRQEGEGEEARVEQGWVQGVVEAHEGDLVCGHSYSVSSAGEGRGIGDGEDPKSIVRVAQRLLVEGSCRRHVQRQGRKERLVARYGSGGSAGDVSLVGTTAGGIHR